MSFLVVTRNKPWDTYKPIWIHEKKNNRQIKDTIDALGGPATILAVCATRKDGEKFIDQLNEKLKINN